MLKLLVVLSFLSVFASAQAASDAKRIAGDWVFTDTEGKRKTYNVRIRVDGDSILLMQEDEYGNYVPEDGARFPVVPHRSGPKGLSFQVKSIEIDDDGDSIGVSRFLSFVGLQKAKVEVSIGTAYHFITKKPETGDQSRWYEKLTAVVTRTNGRKLLARRVK